MNVQINGEMLEIQEGISLLEWAKEQNIPLETVIVEYNGEILPQDRWGMTQVKDGDQIEFFRFVGGGR
jgi:sulfur carrier protein